MLKEKLIRQSFIMFRALTTLKFPTQLLKSSAVYPRMFFATRNIDESDDDFKPKSKVKEEKPEEVLKFIDKVGLSC